MKDLKTIAIHSAPRSGSSWLGQIFNSSPAVAYRYQPLFSYTHKGKLTANSSSSEIDSFFEDILNTNDSFVLQRPDGKIHVDKLQFQKDKITHLVYKEVRYHYILSNLLEKYPDIKVIGLVRNPLAVLHSWQNAPSEFDPAWNFQQEWKNAELKNKSLPENYYGFECWKKLTLEFTHLEKSYPNNFRIVFYSDLLSDPEKEIRHLFDWCELPINAQTLGFIKSSRSETQRNNSYSIYNNRLSDNEWVSQLDKEIIKCVEDELTGLNLQHFMRTV
jgi:hypothetical protein